MKSPGAALLIVAIISTACTTDTQPQPPQYTATDKSAREVLKEVTEDVEKNGVRNFCERFAAGIDSCSFMLGQAQQDCVLPGPAPSVKRSAAVPARNGGTAGWVLELEGHTRDGQHYVSEFFVTPDQGKIRAHVAIYWTGMGLDNSPLGPNNTVVPQAACLPSPNH